MVEKLKKVHKYVTIFAWFALGLSLVWFATSYPNLPDEIGIHFDGDGNFDVHAEKYYGLYPYAVVLITLILCGLASKLSKKVRFGLDISDEGEEMVKAGLTLYLDIFKTAYLIFYGFVWAECIIYQHSLNTDIPRILLLALFAAFIVFLVFAVVIIKKYNKKKVKHG
jgi:hypothetical protein